LIQAENSIYYDNAATNQKKFLAASIHKTNASIFSMSNELEERISSLKFYQAGAGVGNLGPHGGILYPNREAMMSNQIQKFTIGGGGWSHPKRTSIEIDMPRIKKLSNMQSGFQNN
jgi:hypothetical protein